MLLSHLYLCFVSKYIKYLLHLEILTNFNFLCLSFYRVNGFDCDVFFSCINPSVISAAIQDLFSQGLPTYWRRQLFLCDYN